MCGICGSVGRRVAAERLRYAADSIRHRGPDEAGYFQDASVSFAIRRLSIIDLTGGSQPQTNETGMVRVVFNGEIYNFVELRDELRSAGHRFESASDTEVIVHGYEQWGLDCFSKLNGIFGIAIWDVTEGRLVLARDHLGVKPLYHSSLGGALTFGSELKPLLILLGQTPELDPAAVTQFLRYQSVPAPLSIYQGVHKLEPGHCLTYDVASARTTIRRFWNPLRYARNKMPTTVEEAEDRLASEISSAVKRQLVSDVPLGAFLSGGIDSSTVVAMMQEVGIATKTFSIGFHEPDIDESNWARAVAKHLGTDHHEWVISSQHALEVLPRLPKYFDEPFADASAVPTFLVSEFAREHVTVALSGDGGDELFAGYNRYQQMLRLRQWWRVPPGIRRPVLCAAMAVPGGIGVKVRRGINVIGAPTTGDAYRNLVAVTGDSVVGQITQSRGSENDAWPSGNFREFELLEAMALTDLVTYLPDTILTKLDRATMAHSLEGRVPLLDPRVVELAVSLPISTRTSDGPKSILKRILGRYLPAEFIDRPKQGFGIPIHKWLRDELSGSLKEHLSAQSLSRHGLIDPTIVADLMQEHESRRVNHGYTLWAIYMFQLWFEFEYKPTDVAAEPRMPVRI